MPASCAASAASVDDIADLELSEASAGATSETEAEGPGSVATESSEGEAWVEDMCGEPTGALINDEGEPVVGIRVSGGPLGLAQHGAMGRQRKRTQGWWGG